MVIFCVCALSLITDSLRSVLTDCGSIRYGETRIVESTCRARFSTSPDVEKKQVNLTCSRGKKAQRALMNILPSID